MCIYIYTRIYCGSVVLSYLKVVMIRAVAPTHCLRELQMTSSNAFAIAIMLSLPRLNCMACVPLSA